MLLFLAHWFHYPLAKYMSEVEYRSRTNCTPIECMRSISHIISPRDVTENEAIHPMNIGNLMFPTSDPRPSRSIVRSLGFYPSEF